MSMMLMVKAMQARVGNPLRKLVLIKLADNANDAGECWPSYQHVADQCEISRSTVKNHVRELEKAGFLRREYRKNGALNQSNVFHLTFDGGAATALGGAATALGGAATALGGAATALGGGAGAAPRTSHSLEPVNEPVNEPKDKVSQKLDFSSWPSMPSQNLMDEWKALRRRMKATVTQTVVSRTGKELQKAQEIGFTVDQCFEQWIYKGWRGFEAAWMTGCQRVKPQSPMHNISGIDYKDSDL